jgi:hypothetical protein
MSTRLTLDEWRCLKHPAAGLAAPNRPFHAPRETEDDLQCAVIAHWRARWTHGSLVAAIPNGGLRSKATAGRLKAQGVAPGMPDLFCASPDRPFGFWIELKRPGTKNVEKALSDDQKKIRALLQDRGYEVYVLADLDEVLAVLKEKGVIL